MLIHDKHLFPPPPPHQFVSIGHPRVGGGGYCDVTDRLTSRLSFLLLAKTHKSTHTVIFTDHIIPYLHYNDKRFTWMAFHHVPVLPLFNNQVKKNSSVFNRRLLLLLIKKAIVWLELRLWKTIFGKGVTVSYIYTDSDKPNWRQNFWRVRGVFSLVNASRKLFRWLTKNCRKKEIVPQTGPFV